jgi:hypothetical protein
MKKNKRGKAQLPNNLAQKRNVVNAYKQSAKRRNLPFELTEEEAFSFIDKICFYCGSPPSSLMVHYKGQTPMPYTGIDRVDNSIGYTMNNLVPCCYSCNVAKAGMSMKEFLDKIESIYNRLIKPNAKE